MMLDAGGAAAPNTADFIKDVTEADFMAEVIDASMQVPVIVDFWAPWCGPCKTLGPILEKLAGEYGGAFRLAKIDVEPSGDPFNEISLQEGTGRPSNALINAGAGEGRLEAAGLHRSLKESARAAVRDKRTTPTEVLPLFQGEPARDLSHAAITGGIDPANLGA